MKIEISVQEYFNELKLMEKHYGQEEDLYPWIYMLLQIAEEKKQDILQDWYSKVSIRDVHNGQYYSWKKGDDEDNWKIRWELNKNVGFPDFAIINTNNKVIGCVEVKKTKDELFMTEPSQQYEYTKDYEEDVDYVLEQIKAGIKKEPVTGVTYEENPLPDMKTVSEGKKTNNQVLGHLLKFGKVIYTNGLKFYLLTVETISKTKNNNNIQYKINVTELANLTNSYKNYKSGEANASTLLEAVAEWDKLIAGLTKINWHAEPTTLISEDSK